MSNAKKCAAKNRHIVPKSNIFYLRIRNNSMQKFFESHETNAWGPSSIRVQPERRAALGSQRILQEKPRGGSRAAVDTHSFRPLVQEEKVSFGEGYSSLCPRVNLCLASSRKSAADSILDGKRVTRMKSNSFLRSVVLLAVVAAAVPAFAKPVSKTININQSAKVGQAKLDAGEYRLMIDGDKATVQKGKQVVAQSNGRWEDRDTKSNYDAVLLNDAGQVSEVRFAGDKKVFVFSE